MQVRITCVDYELHVKLIQTVLDFIQPLGPLMKIEFGIFSIISQKFCNRATKAFVALAHQMPSSFRNSWSRFTDSVLQRLIPRGVITEVVFTQSNHSRT